MDRENDGTVRDYGVLAREGVMFLDYPKSGIHLDCVRRRECFDVRARSSTVGESHQFYLDKSC